MKRSLYALLLMLFASLSVAAQNLVPNCSFEQKTACPTGAAQMANCISWRAHTATTPDYYNSCGTGLAGVPTNFAGYQPAAQGNAYAGLVAYTSNTYREYIAAAITPMTIGVRYKVSMYIALANVSAWGSNNIGVHFYDIGPSASIANSNPLTFTPSVSYKSYGPLTDTFNWVKIVNTFVADSAYDNMVIGGFYDLTNIDTTRVKPGNSYAYYYIDSVEVTPDRNISLNFADSMFCVGDTMKVPFGVNNAGLVFLSTNVFSLELSDASGSFASSTLLGAITGNTSGMFKYVIPSTITSGTNYRIRIKSSNVVDSSDISPYKIAIGNTKVPKPIASNNGAVCTGNALVLTATNSITGASYKWTGPNGFSTNSNPATIFPATVAATGSYIYTVTSYGCFSKDTTYATVISGTGAVNATSNGPICIDDSLKLFGNLSLGSAFSYSWTGPNGFSSSSKDTLISKATASIAGDYIFTSALVGGCFARDTVTVVVKSKVANHSASSSAPVCTGDPLNLFSNSNNAGISYAWSGPSFASAVQNPSLTNIQLAAAGNYMVSYTTGNGCYVYDTVNVVVNQSPLNITASYNNPLCQADTVKLNATNSSSGVTWGWTGPVSFSASTQNTFVANTLLTATGRYYVTATAANGCYRKDSVDVIVKPLPANFSASSNSPVCQGGTLNLSGNTTSTTGVSFNWSGPSFSSASQSPPIANAQPVHSGNYILTAIFNGCAIRDTETVSVIAIPATPVPTANTPVCVGQTLNLTAGITAPGYQWTGPSFTSSAQNPIIANATNAIAGVYSVKAFDGACVSATATVNVTVIATPVATAYPSPKDSICLGAPVNFFGSAANAGVSPIYKWYKNNTLITGANISSYNTTTAADYDEYFCTVTSNGTCSIPVTDTGNKIKMRVFPWLAPAVSIAATPNGTVQGNDLITFNATPTNGGNFPVYQWKRNNKDVVGALSNTWGAKTLDNKDVICVVMTSSYLCPQPKTASSNCITVSINTTGINDTKLMSGVNIYPNPVTNELNVEGISIGTRMSLIDVLGRVVVMAVSTIEKEIINTSSLVSGTYLLQLVNDNGGRMNAKVVKE